MSIAVSHPEVPIVEASPTALAGPETAVVAVGFSNRSTEGAAYVVEEQGNAALERLGIDAFALLDRDNATGSGGEVISSEAVIEGAITSVLLVGLGSGTSGDYRRAGASLVRNARQRGPVATSIGALADDVQLAAFVEGLVLGAFGFRRRSEPRDGDDADRPHVVLTGVSQDDRGPLIRAAEARAHASWRSRSWSLTPSNEKGPVQLEQWAREAADRGELELTVWDEDRLAADGFGGILAVGAGSAYESRFLRLDYTAEAATPSTPRVVLVGKGITFDTGGISIKPRDAMMTMKRDMTGAAVVLAVMGALRELAITVNVTGLVASAENAFGAASARPGDIVTHYGGRTSEIGNTDAEGRLVLADALAYGSKHIDATAVVDIATLTGAGKVALGTSLGALFSNSDTLASALRAAGDLAGEPVWRLPLSGEYEPLLENAFADATNAAGGPGAITAALFLQHFAGGTPWAHLDIASVGDSAKDAFEYSLGATGFGSRLVLRWLEGLSAGAPTGNVADASTRRSTDASTGGAAVGAG